METKLEKHIAEENWKAIHYLYEAGGQIECVVKALGLDPSNEDLKELLMH